MIPPGLTPPGGAEAGEGGPVVAVADGALRVLVLGASGGVGQQLLRQGLDRGLALTAQTRSASKLARFRGRVSVGEADPLDAARIAELVRGQDAVVFALGIDTPGRTTLFSEATRILIAAMEAAGVRRLIAITGVGAGETRGHGGLFYDWIIFPFFTRARYADKERQEALIEASELDWVIIRPAPFSESRADGPLQVHTRIGRDTVLRRIARAEVATFVLDQLSSDRYLRQKPFIGHP
jgi:putative NADH-flavin reductase